MHTYTKIIPILESSENLLARAYEILPLGAFKTATKTTNLERVRCGCYILEAYCKSQYLYYIIANGDNDNNNNNDDNSSEPKIPPLGSIPRNAHMMLLASFGL